MARFSILLLLANLVLVIYTTIECLTTPSAEIRNLPKAAWVALILLFQPVGWIAWWIAGRPRPGAAPRKVVRPAPDDDPDFLRGLAEQARSDERLFQQWEEDLRRREDDLRKKNENPDEP